MMEETNTPYKHLSNHGNDMKTQAKPFHQYLSSSKKQSNNTTVVTMETSHELQHFRETSQNNNDYTSLPNGIAARTLKGKYTRVNKRSILAVGTIVMVICLLLISIIYIWMTQQRSNNDILEDITSLKENLKEDNNQIIRNITILKRRVAEDNRDVSEKITKLRKNIYTGSQNVMKEVTNIKQNLKEDIKDINKEITTMKKTLKKDYCYGKSVCYPYSTCYGSNCTCDSVLPRDQRYCQRSQCWPSKITSAYSNTKDGRTYMTIGSFMYQFKHRYPGERFASVAKTWPRSSYEVWKAFEVIDEMFIHSDRHTYIFSGDEYVVHLQTTNDSKSLLPARKLGHGTDEQGRAYIGWQGLKHSKYIDAALHNYGDKTYIFQDDLVYLWNSSIPTSNGDHFPRGAVESGWPRNITQVFPGVPNNIDTAFMYYYNRKIYFMKGQYFYTWDKENNKAKGPHLTKDYWRYLCDTYVCSTNLCSSTDG